MANELIILIVDDSTGLSVVGAADPVDDKRGFNRSVGDGEIVSEFSDSLSNS